MPDAIFSEPRLAEIYDALDSDRGDLKVYASMVDEFEATSVLDVGCGTGTFACMLANRGIEVVAVDPAQASLEVARSKPGSSAVRWIHADAANLPQLSADLAFMTGNVAQVFLTDESWSNAVRNVHRSLHDGSGRFVFETRDPSRRAWESWTHAQTRRRIAVSNVGDVETWTEMRSVEGEFVTFTTHFVFERDEAHFESDSTLRFREQEVLECELRSAGFLVEEIRDAPDRPSKEFVFIARKHSGT